MSQRAEQLTERLSSLDSAADYVEAWYHVPLLVVLVVFMFWIRVRNWKNFLVNGRVYFQANDPWYHLRQVQYTVRHWPWTMPFDPWTGFPTGNHVGQFGTLYDQLVATAALVVGLGSPTEQTTALVLLFAPAVFGVLVVIPTYYLGKRFGGRFGGVIGVAVLALSPSSFLARSVVGFSDHHVAEVLFQALAVTAIVVALAVAEREKPVYEQFRERDFENLRRPVGWAALAGFAITLYIWTWPPGLLLVGIFGVFLLIALPLQYLRGESPEHVAIASAVALAVAGVLMLVTFKTFDISVTNFSILHPMLALVGALGCVFMAWFARLVESRDLSPLVYPGVIYGIVILGVVVFSVALPTLFAFFLDQLNRIVGFGTGQAALTVAEIKPPFTVGAPLDKAVREVLGFFHQSYGYAYLTAAAGAVIMLVRVALGRSERWAASVFVLAWTALMTSATLTQARFNYYLVVPVAVMNAYLIGQVLRFIGTSDVGSSLRNLEPYQVLSVALAIALVIAPMAFLGGAGPITFLAGGPLTAVGASANAYTSGPGSVLGWDDSLEWLQNNTPAEGQYNGDTNSSLEYYGTYTPSDSNFNYTNGTYGILSWWDYGHWITVLGHRIPVANPFQQHARIAANYLLATNTTAANNIARMGDGAGVRYVMISWEMADPAGILAAPFAWENKWSVSFYDAMTPIVITQNGKLATVFYAHEQRYYESMRTRLYAFHGSEIEREPVVLNYQNPIGASGDSLRYAFYPTGENTSVVKRFPNMSAARQFVKKDGSAQIGGVGRYPHERVPALKHYRLVHAAKKTALVGPSGAGPLFQIAVQRSKVTGLNKTELFPTTMNWVKTFERVPGARVVGHGPPDSIVEATVEMRVPTTNTTFTYTQQAKTNAQGRFTMILPYSTTGYEKWGTQKGATNVSVQATGPYTFYTVEGQGKRATWTATAEVPEGMVIGRVDGPVRVTLHEEPGNPLTDGNASNANATSATATNTTGNSTTATTAAAGNDSTGTENSSSEPNTTAANAKRGSTVPPKAEAR